MIIVAAALPAMIGGTKMVIIITMKAFWEMSEWGEYNHTGGPISA